MSRRTETRKCLHCHQIKTFRADAKFCSRACADLAKRKPITETLVAAQCASDEQTENARHIHLPSTRIHTLEQLIEHFEIDTRIWQVERFIANKWEVGAKDTASVLKVEPLYQVKVWLKRKVHVANALAEIESLKQAAVGIVKAIPTVRYKPAKTGRMLEISIPDLHMNKLAWGKETGHGNYDTAIAEQLHDIALEALVARTSSLSFEKICLVVGNDLLNTDGKQSQTTAGTPQSTDSRYERTFVKTREMITRAILRLRQIAPVHIVMVRGNHDYNAVWHLGDSLWCLFHDKPHVSIDNSPVQRKYLEYGKVLLMWTHGNEEKQPDLPLLMAVEECEAWGRTRWREVHVGHWHQTGLLEKNGVRVRKLPSLTPPDEWHARKGYVGNIRSAEAYAWDMDEGLVLQATYANWD